MILKKISLTIFSLAILLTHYTHVFSMFGQRTQQPKRMMIQSRMMNQGMNQGMNQLQRMMQPQQQQQMIGQPRRMMGQPQHTMRQQPQQMMQQQPMMMRQQPQQMRQPRRMMGQPQRMMMGQPQRIMQQQPMIMRQQTQQMGQPKRMMMRQPQQMMQQTTPIVNLSKDMLIKTGILSDSGIHLDPGQKADCTLKLITQEYYDKDSFMEKYAKYKIDFDRLGPNVVLIQLPSAHQGRKTARCTFYSFVNSYLLGMSKSFEEAIQTVRSPETVRIIDNLVRIWRDHWKIKSRKDKKNSSLRYSSLCLNSMFGKQFAFEGKDISLIDLARKPKEKLFEGPFYFTSKKRKRQKPEDAFYLLHKDIKKAPNCMTSLNQLKRPRDNVFGKVRASIDYTGNRKIKRTYIKFDKDAQIDTLGSQTWANELEKTFDEFKSKPQAETIFLLTKRTTPGKHMIAVKAEKFIFSGKTLLTFIVLNSSFTIGKHIKEMSYIDRYKSYAPIFKTLATHLGFPVYPKETGKNKPIKKTKASIMLTPIFFPGFEQKDISPDIEMFGKYEDDLEKELKEIEKDQERKALPNEYVPHPRRR